MISQSHGGCLRYRNQFNYVLSNINGDCYEFVNEFISFSISVFLFSFKSCSSLNSFSSFLERSSISRNFFRKAFSLFSGSTFSFKLTSFNPSTRESSLWIPVASLLTTMSFPSTEDTDFEVLETLSRGRLGPFFASDFFACCTTTSFCGGNPGIDFGPALEARVSNALISSWGYIGILLK